VNKQHRIAILGIALLAVSSLIGCANQPPAQPQEPVIIQPNSFMRQWRADLQLKADQVQSLFVRENLLFIYSAKHNSFVLDTQSGEIGRVDLVNKPTDRLFPPLVDAKRIIYPTQTSLEVINRDNDQRKSIDLKASMSTPAVMQKDMVFFGIDHAGGGRIQADDVSVEYGHNAWEVMTLGGLTAAPALHSNILYFGGEDGHVYALTTDKEQGWATDRSRFDAKGRIIADMMVDDYAVYATVSNGTVYALDRSRGRIKWQYFAPRGLKTNAVPGTTQVYVTIPGEGVAAIDKINGLYTRQPKWIVAGAMQVLTEDNQRVYLRSKDNAILAVDKQSGEIVFQSAYDHYEIFATNMATPIIYAATKNGAVYAITPVTKTGLMGHIAMGESEILPLALAK